MDSRYEDADLSTLTNIRLNNRRAKQRLARELDTETTGGFRQADFQDESTLSPLKPQRRRATEGERQSAVLNAGRSRSSIFNSSRAPAAGTKHRTHDVDTSLLDMENLRYLDDDSYERDSKRNREKRERFLRTIVSSPDVKTRPPNNYEYNTTEKKKNYFEDSVKQPTRLSFRPRDIPDLKPSSDRGIYISPVPLKRVVPSVSPVGSRRSIPKSTHEYTSKVANDDDFDRLVKKYNLKNETEYTFDNGKSSVGSELAYLKTHVKQMEEQLEQYQRELMNSKSSVYDSDELYKKNLELASEIKKLNQFIKFMDSNFSDMYSKWRADKQEKERLQALVDSMGKLDIDKSPTKAWKRSPVKPLNLRRDSVENTEQLLNLNFLK